MYGWVWRKLPGHWSLKLLESIAMIAVICVALVVIVFPWVEPKLPFSGNTVDGGRSTTTPSAPPTGSTPSPSGTDTLIPGDNVIPGDH